MRQNSCNTKLQFLLQIAVLAALAVTALASPVYESQSYIQSTSGSVISHAPTLSQSPVLTYAQEPVVTYSQAPLAVAHAPAEVEHYVRIPFQTKLIESSEVLLEELTVEKFSSSDAACHSIQS